MTPKHSPSKDRFRAGRRIAEKAAQKIRGLQLFFPWFLEDRPPQAPAPQAPAPNAEGRARA